MLLDVSVPPVRLAEVDAAGPINAVAMVLFKERLGIVAQLLVGIAWYL